MYSFFEFRENALRPIQDFPFYVYPLFVQKSGPHVPIHWHEEAEIILPRLAGCLEADGQLYSFEKNDILFVNPGQLHGTSVKESGTVIHMVFHPKLFTFLFDSSAYHGICEKLLDRQLLLPAQIKNKTAASRLLLPLLSHMLEAAEQNTSCSPLLLASDFYQLMAQLQLMELTEYPAAAENTAALSYIRKAIDYMQRHIDTPFRIGDVSKYLGISEGYFSRIFKYYTHTTPVSYCNDRKLEAAHAFLLKGYNVTEAAQNTGFNNISYFIRIYKNKYGISPNKTRLFQSTD